MKARLFGCCLLILLLCFVPLTSAASDATKENAEEIATGVLDSSEGEQVYAQICQGCHMSGGRGAIGAGYYPAFANNPRLASANYMVVTILNGRRNMPSFSRHDNYEFFFPETWLSDAQIANVINFIRSHFGNHYIDTISEAEVAALHVKESEK